MSQRPQFRAPNAPKPAVDVLNHFLDERLAQGKPLEPGDIFQFAWCWFQVVEKEGQLILRTPEFGVTPMSFVEDCSDALTLSMKQRYFAESFSPAISGCHAGQGAIAIKDLDQCKILFMDRMKSAEGNHSGWFFGAQDSKLDTQDPENFEMLSLWDLFCRWPACGECLWLPPDWQVLFPEGKPVVLKSYEPALFAEGSYFHEQYMKS